MRSRHWILAIAWWPLLLASFLCCFYLIGIWGVGVPFVWGTTVVCVMDSATKSASPTAWKQADSKTKMPWVWLVFFAITLTPSIIIGLGYTIAVSTGGGIVVGVTSAVLTMAGGSITARILRRVWGSPGVVGQPPT